MLQAGSQIRGNHRQRGHPPPLAAAASLGPDTGRASGSRRELPKMFREGCWKSGRMTGLIGSTGSQLSLPRQKTKRARPPPQVGRRLYGLTGESAPGHTVVSFQLFLTQEPPGRPQTGACKDSPGRVAPEFPMREPGRGLAWLPGLGMCWLTAGGQPGGTCCRPRASEEALTHQPVPLGGPL